MSIREFSAMFNMVSLGQVYCNDVGRWQDTDKHYTQLFMIMQ